MTEVRFYHLQRKTLEQALPQLLEKTLERGWRAVVMAGSEARVEALNGLLWTYTREGFLPHGTKKDGYAERQPVWLTDSDENPNNANVLFLVDGAESSRIGEFDLCCDGVCYELMGYGNVDRFPRWRSMSTIDDQIRDDLLQLNRVDFQLA